jgi:hypothetical protein
MTQHSSIRKSIIYFTILMILVSVGCIPTPTAMPTPTAAPTPTAERLKLINGKIDACLLVSSTEVETISGIKVASKLLFQAGATACQYFSVTDIEGRVILVTYVNTDESLKKSNDPYSADSALELYELRKQGDLNLQKEIGNPDTFKVEDIDNFGDQAYFKEGPRSEINILKNKILYSFSTSPIDSGGISYDALMELAKIAIQRMP